MDNSTLLLFLQGKTSNVDGLYIQDIWNFSFNKLEHNHKYIQWLFPIDTASNYSRTAPVIYAAWEGCHDSVIKENMKKSFAVLLNFYGLAYEGKNIVKASSYPIKALNWLTPFNHNFLRITRILTALKLFGLDEEHEAFLAFLNELQKKHPLIIGKSIQYWKKRLKYNQLNL